MKKIAVIITLLTLSIHIGFTQTKPVQYCGTVFTQEQIDNIHKTSKHGQQNQYRKNRSISRIPIQIHIIRKSNGTDGLDASSVPGIINRLNNNFANANMSFYQCNDINYIDSDAYYDLNGLEQIQVDRRNNVSNVINIYFANSVHNGVSRVCGFTTYNNASDYIFIKNGCTGTRKNTVSHEIGHYFSLIHTHGISNTNVTDELVNGSNCSTAGDQICDTPADPNLSGGLLNRQCQYIGTAIDINGDAYRPNPNNIMSYGRSRCFTTFTPQQNARMVNDLVNVKYYLSCTSSSKTLNEDENIDFGIEIYPNPSKNIFNIQWENASEVSYDVYDITGKIIYSKKNMDISENTSSVDLSNYTKGMYFLKINLDGIEKSTKLIKN